ncbi:MAG TPA: hypothetical protein EYM39_13330, partial [Candidatus Latescibacteria bacterium]|nr:hypothetical protein [Candidatus Latescibacterota bacterium]
MLAVDLPLPLQVADDDQLLQAAPVNSGPVEAPVATVNPKHELTTPTAGHLDAWFATESSGEAAGLVVPAEDIDSLHLEDAFAEVDELLLEAPSELAATSSPAEITAAENTSDDPLAEPSNTTIRISSVADFTWPSALLVDQINDETTTQKSVEQLSLPPLSSESTADPIRGPPGATGAENSLFSSAFLNSRSSNSGDGASSAPRQLVVIDPQLDNISVLASRISAPGIDLLTLVESAESLIQIESALGQS